MPSKEKAQKEKKLFDKTYPIFRAMIEDMISAMIGDMIDDMIGAILVPFLVT